jgi:alpha-glucosidase
MHHFVNLQWTLATNWMHYGVLYNNNKGEYIVYRNKTSQILDYFVMYGPEISNVVESFAEIIGKPALIPKYALGFFFSN